MFKFENNRSHRHTHTHITSKFVWSFGVIGNPKSFQFSETGQCPIFAAVARVFSLEILYVWCVCVCSRKITPTTFCSGIFCMITIPLLNPIIYCVEWSPLDFVVRCLRLATLSVVGVISLLGVASNRATAGREHRRRVIAVQERDYIKAALRS